MAPCLLLNKSSPPRGGLKIYPSQNPRARDDDDEEAAYESYMNPEPGFQSGSVNADQMAPCLLSTNTNSDETLTPELMAVNPESIPSRAKVETITTDS